MTRNQMYLAQPTPDGGLILPVSALAQDGLSGFALTSLDGPPVALEWSVDGGSWQPITLPHTLAPGLLRLTRTDTSAVASVLNGHYTDADGVMSGSAQGEVVEAALSAPQGGQVRRTFILPEGVWEARVLTSGGTGDADLFVRQGQEPTTSDYDQSSELSGNTERVLLPSPAAGSYHILLNAYAPFEGLTLTTSWGGPPPSSGVLAVDTASESFALQPGESRRCTFEVPAGARNLRVLAQATGGQYGLTASPGVPPSAGGSGNAPVEAALPQAGTWGAVVSARSAVAGVRVTAHWARPVDNGVAVTGLSAGDYPREFYVPRPAGAATLTAVTTGGAGDLILSVQNAQGVQVGSSSAAGSNEETVTLSGLSDGEYTVTLLNSYTDVSLTVTWS